MNKIKVAVIMGGKSDEHEVSILSGQHIVSNLNKTKYDILPIIISKDGSWSLTSKNEIANLVNPLDLRGTNKDIRLKKKIKINGVDFITNNKIDVVFIAMHGKFGEDGTIQGLLELTGIPYTGSGVAASAMGMDKDCFRKIMFSEKLPIPKHVVLKKGAKIDKVHKVLGIMPYFVKPVSGGSSVGASIANNLNELKKSIDLAFKYDDRVLVDEYIDGFEVTCAVVGGSTPKALPVVEIRPLKGKFFDYESKYAESGSEEIVPARINQITTKKIQQMSIKVFNLLNCKGFGRVDFILKDNKNPIILEINTIPGLTPMSLFPKAAKAAGVSYSNLLDIIIRNAFT